MRLYLLDLGIMQPGDIPVPGYLIQTDDGTNVLVDTGWPRSFVDNRQNVTDIDDEARIRASMRKVADVAARESAAFVVYGHDAAQWAALKHAPAFYD